MWGYYLQVPEGALSSVLVDDEDRQQSSSVPFGKVHPEVRAGFESRLADLLPSSLFEVVQQCGNSSIQAICSVAARSYARDRVCLVGDAGAVFPPFTGSGFLRAVANATSLADALAGAPAVDDGLRRWDEAQVQVAAQVMPVAERIERSVVFDMPDLATMPTAATNDWMSQPIPGSWSRSPTCDRESYPGEVALDKVDPVNTALVVACVSGVIALASAGLSAWIQLQVTKRERQGRAEERRSDAKVVLDRYRGPLLDAAWQLGDRLDSIRNRDFLAYLSEGSGREQDAKLTALFRFAHYFGWREFIRTEVQLLRFANEEDTRSAAGFLTDVAEVLASDLLDGKWAMLWNDEQRGIGELMTERPSGASSIVRGHAAFHRDYHKTFAPWMERFAGDLLSPAALKSDRLRLLQWALYGLVRQLDEEGTYGGVWIDRSASEIRQPTQHGSITQHEERLRKHLATSELPASLHDNPS